MFLFKTENVLSNNSIFNVDNIEIDKSSYANKNTLLNKAFKKGFIKVETIGNSFWCYFINSNTW